MTQTTQLEVIAADNNLCGEGPIWDAARQRLLWNDMNQALVYQFDWASQARTLISTGLMVAGIALNEGGKLVFGLHLWRGQNDYQTIVAEHDGESLFFNDILADSRGRLYAGTFYWGEQGLEKHGKLYRLGPDGAIQVMDEGLEVSNGLGLSPDQWTLYYADSTARRIYAYEVNSETGHLSQRRIFVQVPATEGMPDGLTVDAAGFIWSAQWYGGQVVRYDPDGKVERRIQLPVSQVASVAFGGPDLTELYITTAAEPWPSQFTPPGYTPDPAALGGSLYRLRMDIQGQPEYQAKLCWHD
jgi:D-xylonolactonase